MEDRDLLSLFFDRIKKIAGGRTLNPWLKSLGWISNDVTRIKEGHIPGSIKLRQLAEAEGINLTWLLTGLGQPFLIEHYLTDASAARRVRQLLLPAKRARVVRLVGSDGRWHLVVWRFADGGVTEAFVTLVGSLGRTCLDQFRGCAADRFITEEHHLPMVSFLAIGEGHIGRHAMFAAGSGLLVGAPQSDSLVSTERPVSYLTAREQLHAALEEMPESRAATWLALLKSAD